MATIEPTVVAGCVPRVSACGCARDDAASLTIGGAPGGTAGDRPPAAARPPGAGSTVRKAGRHLSLLPALALVVLPKCPLCLAAYLGTLGSLGASSWVRRAWGLPLGVGLVALTLGALALRALQSRDYRPPLVGLAGAAALLGGKFALDAAPLLYAGAAALACASVWSVRVAMGPPRAQ